MDNNIFLNGWNRNNAYAFGWIMSDGCLQKEGRNKSAYAVRICSNDYQIIKWLHEYLCCGNKIYKQNDHGYLIKYRNKESIDFMMDNCLTERKSLNMVFPSIPNEYLGDFIRGYFDGDGSIALTNTRYNTYAQVSFTSGSVEFLNTLQEKLQEHNIRSQIYKDGRSNNNSYYLRATKRSEIEKLFSFMYNDLVNVGFLQRKYDKYLSYMRIKPKYKSHIA